MESSQSGELMKAQIWIACRNVSTLDRAVRGGTGSTGQQQQGRLMGAKCEWENASLADSKRASPQEQQHGRLHYSSTNGHIRLNQSGNIEQMVREGE